MEDIDMYNRVHEMFNYFTTEGSRYNEYAEGFGHVRESGGVQDSRARNVGNNANHAKVVSINQIPGIFGSSFQTVICKPLSGVFNQHICHCVSCQSLLDCHW